MIFSQLPRFIITPVMLAGGVYQGPSLAGLDAQISVAIDVTRILIPGDVGTPSGRFCTWNNVDVEITGALRAKTIEVVGTLRVHGSIVAEEDIVTRSLLTSLHGDIEAGESIIVGDDCTAAGSIRSGEHLRCNSSIEARGNIGAGSITTRYNLTAGGTIKVQRDIRCRFDIKADRIEAGGAVRTQRLMVTHDLRARLVECDLGAKAGRFFVEETIAAGLAGEKHAMPGHRFVNGLVVHGTVISGDVSPPVTAPRETTVSPRRRTG